MHWNHGMEVSTYPIYQDTEDAERNGLPLGSYFPAVRLARGLKWLSDLPHVSRLV